MPGGRSFGGEGKNRPPRTYYEILGVSPGAKPEEIRSAFRRRTLETHPDIPQNRGKEDEFKEVNEAYGVLEDTQKREQYDRLGHAHFASSSQTERTRAPSYRQYRYASPVDYMDPITAERRDYYRPNREIKTLEDEILYELTGDIPQFEDYLKNRAPRWNIDREVIAQVVKTERARKILAVRLESLIRNYGGDRLNAADLYLEYVKKWAELGVDLSNFTNRSEVVGAIEFQAGLKAVPLNSKPERQNIRLEWQNFKSYVESWIKVGWKPSQEILDLLEKNPYF